MLKAIVKNLWPFVVSIVLLLSLFFYADEEVFASRIRQIDVIALTLAFGVFGLIVLIEAGQLVMIFTDYQLTIIRALKLHLIGSAYSYTLPGQMGGDAYKLFRVANSRQEVDYLIPSILLSLLRISGFSVLLFAIFVMYFIAPGLLLNLWESVSNISLHYMVVLIIAFVLIALALLFAVHRDLYSVFMRRWVRIIDFFSIKYLIKVCGRAATLSTVILFLRSLLLFLLLSAVDHRLSLSSLILVSSVTTLISVLPITFAGLGLREGAVIFLLMMYEVDYESALTVAVLGRVFLLILAQCGVAWIFADFVRRKFVTVKEPDK